MQLRAQVKVFNYFVSRFWVKHRAGCIVAGFPDQFAGQRLNETDFFSSTFLTWTEDSWFLTFIFLTQLLWNRVILKHTLSSFNHLTPTENRWFQSWHILTHLFRDRLDDAGRCFFRISFSGETKFSVRTGHVLENGFSEKKFL